MDDWDRDGFGRLLYRHRVLHEPKLSQTDVGEYINTTPSTIGRWERGGNIEPPSRWQVMKLEEVLGIEDFQLLFACRYLPPAKEITVEKLGDGSIVSTIVTAGFLILVVAVAGLHNENQETYGASTIRIIIVPLDQADELVSAHDFPLSLVG
jgi:transcriptional regulator with XRE-family HTH domain